MDSLDEAEARALLAEPHFCDEADPDDWQVLDRPPGAFGFELGLLNRQSENVGLVVHLIYYRSRQTNLITVKMGVFTQQRRQPKVRVYMLEITTKSYSPDNWHDEAHEHWGKSRLPVPEWTNWRSFRDILDFFCRQTNITFRPPLEDPEQLRLS